jgi:hypothetical protein
MKRIIIILFAMEFLLTLGCKKIYIGNSFLEKEPGVDVTKDTIFSTLELAQRFLFSAYKSLPYGLPQQNEKRTLGNETLEDLTDCFHSLQGYGGATSTYYPGLYTSGSENGSGPEVKWNLRGVETYSGIRRALIFIENIGQVPNVDPAYRSQLIAEARMVMAVHYGEAFRHYGGLPWINKSYDINDDMSHIPRLTAQATCDSIVALCDKAAADLPWTTSDLSNWDGRFTKAAAMGYKVRVLLFNASPLFNDTAPYLDGAAATEHLTWHGSYDANLWKKTADAAHDLIVAVEASGNYKIYHKAGNSLRQDFQDGYYLRGTGETLISTRVMFRSSTGGDPYRFYWSAWSWGCNLPTQEFVDMFPMANGKPITDLTSGYNPNNPYAGRDPRLYETVLTNGDAFQGRTAELYIGGRERTSVSSIQAGTGYIVRKFLLDRNTTTSMGSIVHWPLLRLPEIYLSFAEADNEFNGGPSAEAYRCVNIIRSRVGLPALPAGLSKVQFREAVLTERACEFGLELVRWHDITRWKRASDFQKHLHGSRIYRSTSTPYTYTYNYFEMPTRYWMNDFSPKWYLSAFPQNEVLMGYGLIQNPGWE